ncbi:MAG: hypothetical protein Q4G65_07495 [bacterium]|nr:hypothetical protein [bacterium]
MSMFFDRKGILLTLSIIFVVILLCVIDLRCSSARDERARRENAPQFGAIAHVKEEMAAGKQAWAQQREEQLNEQLRMLRVMTKRFAEKGENTRARATIALIQEIEQEKRRRAEKSATDR